MTAGKKILLAHGGGGRLSGELINEIILPAFDNKTLSGLTDSAEIKLDSQNICFTTDSYVIKPLFFSGGDIGKLAVCGTLNDLAVCGAKPVAISMALIIEEGLEIEILRKILNSAAQTAKQQKVSIVCGDTKVVETGGADKIFINTSGIGIKLPQAALGFEKIKTGDAVIISGTIADHGMTIMSQREGIKFESSLKSDCAAVSELCIKMIETFGSDIKFMRDPTRGGLAATLNEIADKTDCSIEIYEEKIPVEPTVKAAAEMLGFDVLEIANEGKFVAIVSADKAEQYLELCRNSPLGKNASLIGSIAEKNQPLVELITAIEGRRIVQMPYGRELPRIC